MSDLLDAVVPVRPISILVAEDEPGDRELLEIALARNSPNCKMVAVEDGFDALKYLRREPPFAAAQRPDLIILDLNLPGKHGREVLRELKTDENFNSIPVIILSTSHDDGDVTGSYRLGASSYIVKPGNFRDFNTVVRRLQEYWLQSVTLPRHHS
ncbi:MAG TPA: response regulator [Oligoflexus sp.]|uniref:response regulator n=1 Tax=Oligoflexus sp. TaxID=1971216 RepID=UPI002D73FBC6|nr:response regulator [Oligoflexus sp.]HYX36266.1 response regulator [Oligoflexus sp.]